jgi:hypothetical protein
MERGFDVVEIHARGKPKQALSAIWENSLFPVW